MRADPLLRAKIMAMSEEVGRCCNPPLIVLQSTGNGVMLQGAELGVIGSLRKMYSSGEGSALQRYVGMCVPRNESSQWWLLVCVCC